MIISLYRRLKYKRYSPTHPLLHAILSLFLSLSVLASPNTALGQTDDLNLELWTKTADGAVVALADETASSSRLERVRQELSDQRKAALEAQDRLKLRVETLEGELASLGPAPEEGVTEAVEIAARRTELEESIANAKVPLLKAQAAYERADGLIGEIDEVVRGRLSAELTSLGPSPFNPIYWQDVAGQLSTFGQESVGEVQEALEQPYLRSQFLGRVPFAVILILLGLFVQLFGKPRIVRHLREHGEPQGEGAPQPRDYMRRLSIGLVRNFLPLIAAGAIILGIDQLDPRSEFFERPSTVLIPMALSIILAYWLGNAVFAPDHPEQAVIGLDQRLARRARRVSLGIGIIIALSFLVRYHFDKGAFDQRSLAVLHFPLFLVGSYLLARLALTIRSRSDPSDVADEDGEVAAPSSFVIRDTLSRAGLIIAVIVPLLAAVGYFSAANALFRPTVLTFALIGGLVALYTLFRDSLDHWMETGAQSAPNGYRNRFRSVPVLVGLILTCLAVPLLALIWGARVSEVQEVWIWLRDGVTIGDIRLSVTDVLAFILVFAIGYTITRMIQTVVKGSVLPRMDLDRGAANAIVSGIGYVGIFLAAVIAISATGLSLGNLAIVAGALSVGIGFGLQTIVSNFVSGIILLVERPIKEGDWIEVAGYSGYVRKISVRSTLIDTFDRASVIVPNSELIAGSVLNWTHSNLSGRVIVPVGVAYGEDPRKVEKILMEIAKAHPMVLSRPGPAVMFMGFGADSMDFEIRAFLRDVNWMLSARSEMNYSIVKRFEEEGIEIPYAQRDINIRNVGNAAKAFWEGKSEVEGSTD